MFGDRVVCEHNWRQLDFNIHNLLAFHCTKCMAIVTMPYDMNLTKHGSEVLDCKLTLSEYDLVRPNRKPEVKYDPLAVDEDYEDSHIDTDYDPEEDDELLEQL